MVMIAGGEHHTIAVTEEGKVYCWGRNDEGQCGKGDLYGQFKRKRALEEYEKLMKKMEEEEAAKQLAIEEAKAQEEAKKKAEEEKKDEAEEKKEEEKVGEP